MFQSTAILRYDQKQDVLRAGLNDDLDKYYRFLFLKDCWNLEKVWTAKYGSHISVYNPQFHGKHDEAARFDNLPVQFSYDPTRMFRGGYTKGFLGFYLPIESAEIEEVKNSLEIVEKDGFRGLHISLFANKCIFSQKNFHKNLDKNPRLNYC